MGYTTFFIYNIQRKNIQKKKCPKSNQCPEDNAPTEKISRRIIVQGINTWKTNINFII